MNGVTVSAKVNGDAVQYVCPADESLLDVLRNRLNLTGVKEGCGTGDCGACSITLDGRLVCACLVLGAEAEGREIGTVEGLSEGGKLHPLQEEFIEKRHCNAVSARRDSWSLQNPYSSEIPTRPKKRFVMP